jgi:hypothetical protein
MFNSNSSFCITDTDYCKHSSLIHFIEYYIQTLVQVIGLVLSLFCCIIFFKIITIYNVPNNNNNTQMYKYLFIKAINDAFFFALKIVRFIINFKYCGNCESEWISFINEIWSVYIYTI